MNKKISLFLVICSVSFLISGCQKKQSTLSVSPVNQTPNPADLERLNESVSPVTTSSQVPTQPGSNQEFIADSAIIDSLFAENYKLALEDAQRSLKSGVRYCGAKITFYGATLTEKNKQSFIFFSDEFSKDYYWIVGLNGYQENQKTRSFAARKDLVNELKCNPNNGNAPGQFSGAYEEATKSDKFKRIDPGTIAEVTLETMNTGWNVIVTDNAGTNKLSTTINPVSANTEIPEE